MNVDHPQEGQVRNDDSRLRVQVAGVFCAGLLTAGAAIYAKNAVKARRFIPAKFDANHKPPPFNMKADAARALGNATLITTGVFAFGIASTCLLMDVKSPKDFSIKMRKIFKKDEDVVVDDDESVKAIKDWIEKR